MNKLRIVVGILAVLCTAAASTTPAFAKFKAEKATENVLKFENKESATNFKVVGSTGSLTVTCETIKGSGAVYSESGVTGNKASEDLPEKGLVEESSQAGFIIAFEKCTTKVLAMKVSTTVKAEKCQFEFSQAGTKEEKATVSLRAATKEVQCEIKVEVEKLCEAKVSAKTKGENAGLTELKLKNKAKNEIAVEKSVVKKIVTTEGGAGKCGLGTIKESEFEVAKPIVVKGGELV